MAQDQSTEDYLQDQSNPDVVNDRDRGLIHRSFPPQATPMASHEYEVGTAVGKPRSYEPYYKRPEESGPSRVDRHGAGRGYGFEDSSGGSNYDKKKRG